MATNVNKKARTAQGEENDFDKLRKYILECPYLSSENPAIKAALGGLDHELKRRERDAKLQRKFAGCDVSGSDVGNSNENKNLSSSFGADDLMNEWQDVGNDGSGNLRNSLTGKSPTVGNSNDKDKKIDDDDDYDDEVEIIDVDGSTSVLGKRLASIVISTISDFKQTAKSPLTAIAMALHAAMRSEILGFACTGVPEDPEDNKANNKKGKKSAGMGFAAPVRDLPKTQFLPKDWDKHAATSPTTNALDQNSKVLLRYRKDGMASIILKIQQQRQPGGGGGNGDADIVIKVQIIPTTTQEPCNQSFQFSLDQHINLDSWNAALHSTTSARSLPPSLHYKGLSVLLTNFTKSFDLGQIHDGDDNQKNESSSPRSQASVPVPAVPVGTTTFSGRPHPGTATYPFPNEQQQQQQQQQQQRQQREPWNDINEHLPPSIQTCYIPNPNHHPEPGFNPLGGNFGNPASGSFAGDLAPGGLVNPLMGRGPQPGNLMGPNHPIFNGGRGDQGGMHPRFDPFGPPGGPTEINPPGFPGFPGQGNGLRPGRNGRAPGGIGEPNNDLLRPPDINNMFS